MERGSAIIGYTQEHSSPLAADHHSICKFASDTDKNYMCIKDVLKMMRPKIIFATEDNTGPSVLIPRSLTSILNRSTQGRADERRSSNIEAVKELQDILGVSHPSESELNASKAQKMKESYQ